MLKLNAKSLRKFKKKSISGVLTTTFAKKTKKQDIYIILDNVLDTYNIGSIFRLADAVAAKKIYLCDGSETPPNHRIKKASINTTEWVEWEYFEKTSQAIKDLRSKIKGLQIIAIEQSETSVLYDQFDFQFPIAFVVGHESDGISQEVLTLCDGVVELPMFGVNISLTVMVSLGVVLYQVIKRPHSLS